MPSRPRRFLPACFGVFSHEIVVGTDLGKAISRIAVCEFSVVLVASFVKCARDGPSSFWASNARSCSWGARGVLFLLLRPALCLVDNDTFMKLFKNPSFDLEHAPLVFSRSQEATRSESFCLGWLPYASVEGAEEQYESFEVLSRKRGTDGDFIP